MKAISQELFDAVAPGDKTVWERYMSDDCLVIDQEGNVITRDEFLAEMAPLPEGYSGSIELGEFTFRQVGNVAVLTHRDHEQEEIYGQKITAEYQTTSTFIRRSGEWRLLAMHITVIPNERSAANINLDTFNDCLGVYEAAPGVTYTISREGDKLLCLRSGRTEPLELLPSSEGVVFPKGTRKGEFVFVRDADGTVTHMTYRSDNKELIWKRIE